MYKYDRCGYLLKNNDLQRKSVVEEFCVSVSSFDCRDQFSEVPNLIHEELKSASLRIRELGISQSEKPE